MNHRSNPLFPISSGGCRRQKLGFSASLHARRTFLVKGPYILMFLVPKRRGKWETVTTRERFIEQLVSNDNGMGVKFKRYLALISYSIYRLNSRFMKSSTDLGRGSLRLTILNTAEPGMVGQSCSKKRLSASLTVYATSAFGSSGAPRGVLLLFQPCTDTSLRR
ncbi:hypothetical protein B484DRAFT_460415 [Ochromonadaceae sp. CCMP2298]|nr:hypothetical protein B484DRAFT_460415 [Ochromonadaceae sp. CCMP2298]